MSSKVPFPPPGFDDLSPDEQADYASELWDRVTEREHEISVPDWHMEIVRERMARYEREGMEGISLEDLEKELFEQLTNSSKD
ncbi:MAG TPA: addiction module protein [Pyrinomonadaceae bacterium]|nr:addiction module protein [Pyrinomonadaceae bacterium]